VDDHADEGAARAKEGGRRGAGREVRLRRDHDLREARRPLGARGERLDLRAAELTAHSKRDGDNLAWEIGAPACGFGDSLNHQLSTLNFPKVQSAHGQLPGGEGAPGQGKEQRKDVNSV